LRPGEQAERTVVIDCFAKSAARYRDGYAVVAIDVIRATSTAVTGVALNRRCFVVPSIEAATALAEELDDPLIVGELGGHMPYGFHLTNSPYALSRRSDLSRPMILLSTSGTKVLWEAKKCDYAYAGSLRNYTAQIRFLAARHPKVAVIGAGTLGEFRGEDQLCCAWIAEGLINAGYAAADERTTKIVERWSAAPVDAFLGSKSVKYLASTGQLSDLNFILEHLDDLNAVFALDNDEIKPVPTHVPSPWEPRSSAGLAP
jgi:2-phosphosulfolactate phosphatase